MPCNSDYLAPTRREQELQRAAKLLVYVYEKTNKTIHPRLRVFAEDIYCRDDSAVAVLCKVLTELDSSSREALVYNSHDRTARDLADWWEEHQEADAKRERKEARNVETEIIRAAALKKLTLEERTVLGLTA